ncbi:MAG: NAD(P)/FAD-dependent oxidoreductase [Bacillota bacterium]
MTLNQVRAALARVGLVGIEADEERGAVVLTGAVASWDQYVSAGYAAAGQGFRGVVNRVEVSGLGQQPMALPKKADGSLDGLEYDVVVIGGGVIGCAIARELTRWSLSVALLEKEEDVAKHASSRNNGMVHPGFAPTPGSRKAYYNVRGNRLYDQVADELGFRFERCGSLVLLSASWHRLLYPVAARRARRNGVDGLGLLGRRAVLSREPNVWPGQRGAFYLPSAGIVAPYEVTAAYAENALQNGAAIHLNTVALGFTVHHGRIEAVETNRGTIRARAVVNAAGVWADRVAELAGDRFFTIHPRKGSIAILDKKTAVHQSMVFGLLRLKGVGHSKGGGITRTVEGNLLIGPNAIEVPGREDYSTDPTDLEYLMTHHLSLNVKLRPSDIITYFAGVRAATFEEEFIVEPSRSIANLVHAAGIQSPGLAAAPAIAADVSEMVAAQLARQMEVRANPNFRSRRQVSPRLAQLPLTERARLIRQNPAYGRIVCRCETISEGEVVDAINSTLPALTLDGLKRRVRTGMGRCQGGFCTPELISLIARETGQPPTAVTKSGPGSELLVAETKVGATNGGGGHQ